MSQKLFFSKVWYLCQKIAVLEHFWWKHNQGTLGINEVDFLWKLKSIMYNTIVHFTSVLENLKTI